MTSTYADNPDAAGRGSAPTPGGPTYQPKPQAAPTTSRLTKDATIDQRVGMAMRAASQIQAAQDAIGKATTADAMELAIAAFNGATGAFQFASDDLFNSYGLAPDGSVIPEADKDTARANLGARYAELDLARQRFAQEGEQFVAQESRLRDIANMNNEESKADRRERQRDTNINATLDVLEAQVRRGDMKAAEARNAAAAAFDQAQIQRGVLADHAGKNIPAGSSFFPNMEPGGVIGSAVNALLPGATFSGMQTGGTFGIDPNAMAAPVGQAFNNVGSAIPDTDAAIANATKLLAGMGATRG